MAEIKSEARRLFDGQVHRLYQARLTLSAIQGGGVRCHQLLEKLRLQMRLTLK